MKESTLTTIRDLLCKELDELAMAGKMSAGDLDTIHKLTDTIKNTYKIEMYCEEGEGYSERGGYGRNSYGRNGGYSMRGGDWEASGTYGRANGMMDRSYDDGDSYARRGMHYVRGHYSRGDGRMYSRAESKEALIDGIQDMMAMDISQVEKNALRKAMEAIQNS